MWSGFLVVGCAASAAVTPALYADAAQRVQAARVINDNPTVVLLYGPVGDVHSIGQLAMTKMTVLYAVFVALLALVLVRRNLRVEEEAGRADLLGELPVGRDTALAATVLEVSVAAIGLGVLTAAGNAAAALPLLGSIAFGAMWAGVAVCMAAATAVAGLRKHQVVGARTLCRARDGPARARVGAAQSP